jgi:outer membrane lipoprotein-sorting protein
MRLILRWTLVPVLAWAAACAAAGAADPAAPAPAAPAAAADAPPPAPLPPDAAEALDKMDEAGRKIRTLRAPFDYELNQTLYEDVQKRKGILTFRVPNLLRFEFTDKPRETFVFDGRMLYHKKDATRQLVVWEVRLADEPPVESFELGKTPFPMPFGQKRETVVKHFSVSRDADEEKKDPQKRVVLALVPKRETELARQYMKIILWVDAKDYLPRRARLLDTSENVTTIDFRSIEVNPEVDAKEFSRPEVPGDWETVVNPKEPKEAPKRP